MFQQDLSSIVLDVGSVSTKVGYSGQDTPKYLLPSYIGTPINQMIQELPDSKPAPPKHYIGDSFLNLRKQNFQISPIYSSGRIINFPGYQKFLTGILTQEMRIPEPSNFSLLLSEDNIHLKEEREKIGEFVFEGLDMKNLFFCKTAVLSSFATGRSTSVVIDCGATMTSVVTVHDGFALGKNIKRVNAGSEMVNGEIERYVEKELAVAVNPRVVVNNKEGLEYTPSYIKYHKDAVLRDIKETLYRGEENINPNSTLEVDSIEYQLPDKTLIKIQKSKIYNPFLNFGTNPTNPAYSTLPVTFKGIHHLVYQNINQCDIDMKKELYSNMIITGGNSLMNGFIGKLQGKIGEVAPANVKLKVITFPFQIERRFAPWIGGSIVASLSSFQSFWVGKEEWKEHGDVIFEKKCA